MITWKIPVFCCFTKKPVTNRSSFSCFYSVYFSVLSLFLTFYWKKHTISYFFCFHRTKKLHVYSIFPCLNFIILHNFTPCFLNYIRSNFRIYSWCILMYALSCAIINARKPMHLYNWQTRNTHDKQGIRTIFIFKW